MSGTWWAENDKIFVRETDGTVVAYQTVWDEQRRIVELQEKLDQLKRAEELKNHLAEKRSKPKERGPRGRGQ